MNDLVIVFIAVVLIGFGLLRRFLFGSPSVVSAARVQAALDEGAMVVDVRTPEEFAAGHYPGARNIPLDEIVARRDEVGKPSEVVVLYCASGNRSGQAVALLRRYGFVNLINGGGLHHMPVRDTEME